MYSLTTKRSVAASIFNCTSEAEGLIYFR